MPSQKSQTSNNNNGKQEVEPTVCVYVAYNAPGFGSTSNATTPTELPWSDVKAWITREDVQRLGHGGFWDQLDGVCRTKLSRARFRTIDIESGITVGSEAYG